MAKCTYLCFHQGTYHFAIENSEVLRILPVQSLSVPPLPIPAVNGLMVLDDTLVAVIDIVQAMFQNDQAETHYHIFMRSNQEVIGICASHIDGLRTIDDTAWEPYHKTLLPFILQEAENILYLIHLK